MSRKFLVAIDLAKNELQNAAVQNLASAPASPVKGQLYFNSTAGDNTLYWWDGTTWVPAKASASVPLSGTVSDLAPGNANNPGAGTTASRGDHVHGLPAFAAVAPSTAFGQAAANGSATTFIRSDHVHGTPTHDDAAHSAIHLNALATPNGNVNMGGWYLQNLNLVPLNASDAVSKNYVDNMVAGLSWKDPVRAATTGNVTLSGTQTIDGVALVAGDRVLVKNQTNATANGIYTVAAGAWPRASDADVSTEIEGAAVFVSEGTTLGNTGWVMTADSPITFGSTNLTWAQFMGGGQYIGGAGLTLTGNTFDVGAGTGITVAADTVALDTAYTDGLYVNVAGDTMTGALTVNGALTAQSGLTANALATFNGEAACGLAPSTPTRLANKAYVDLVAARRFGANCAAATSTVVNHAFGTRDVVVEVARTTTPWDTVECDVERTDVNNVTVRFATAPAAGEYRITVLA